MDKFIAFAGHVGPTLDVFELLQSRMEVKCAKNSVCYPVRWAVVRMQQDPKYGSYDAVRLCEVEEFLRATTSKHECWEDRTSKAILLIVDGGRSIALDARFTATRADS